MNEKNNGGGNSLELENVSVSQPGIYESGLMQTRSPYSTAVQVIKPRNMELVEKKCIADASIAGDSFLYQWEVNERLKDNTFRKKLLIGLSIGAALSIARNMGNNAVDVNVEERVDSYIFYAAYIDLETGFNLRRAFRQRKEQSMGEKYKKDGRAEDIIFQIGQSKAIRNVCLNAAPVWLTDKVLEASKNSFVDKVERDPSKYKKLCETNAEKLSIPFEKVELKYGKITGWDARKIVSCLMELRTVEDGLDDADKVFPSEKSESDNTPPETETKSQQQPQIENVGVVIEEKKEPDKPFVIDWENPDSIIEGVRRIPDMPAYNKFRKENKRVLSTIGGKDQGKIVEALEKKENELLKLQK